MKPTETLVSQFFVAGLIYSDYQRTTLKPGQRLSLVKDPTNPHDSHAVKVFTAGRKPIWLGYVPRTQTHEVRNFRGKVTRAVIRSWAETNATHRMCLVDVMGVAAAEIEANTIC